MRRTISAGIFGLSLSLFLSLFSSACSTLPDTLAFDDPSVRFADDEFPELMTFLEEERGLTFLEPVPIRRADVTAELTNEAEQLEADGGEAVALGPQNAAYNLLGLLESGADAGSEAADARAEVAGAFYDPYTDEIVMPEGQVTEAVRALLVHELTHALQDQNGLLVRKLETEDEGFVHLALIEGDADRMRSAWIEQLPDASRDALSVEYQAGDGEYEELNGFSTIQFVALYALGQPAAEILIADRGIEGFNEVLKDGGGSTERLIDPLTPTAEPAEAEVREAPSSTITGDSLGEGTIGPLTLYLALVAADMSPSAALDAVLGYDNDRYQVIGSPDGPCLVGWVWLDNVGETEALVTAFERVGWTASATSAGDPAAPAVNYEGCTPIAPVREQRLELLTPVWVSNWSSQRLIAAGVDPIRARCRSLTLATRIPVADISFDQFDFETIDRLAGQPWVTESCPE